PAVGDEERAGWLQPLNAAIYPPMDARRRQIQAPGCVEFKSKDSVLVRPGGSAGTSTVSPGLHVRSADPPGSGEFAVVWWDPRALKLGAEAPLGIRRPELIVKDVAPDIVEAGLAAYNSWRERRRQILASGAQSALAVQTVTELAKGAAERPSGRRFGALMHAVLATLPLDGAGGVIRRIAAMHGRILGAPEEEIE